MSKVSNYLLATALVASIGLNVATFTVQSVATVMSAVVSTVVGSSRVLPAFKTVMHRGERKVLSQVVRETTRRVATRTARGATRSAASVFGEAVPAAGIAVIVGAAAWELKDACDTLKDLHELDLAMSPEDANPSDVDKVCGLKVPSKEEVWTTVKSSPSDAWNGAKEMMPDLPDMPDMPSVTMPDWDLSFWN